MKKFVFLLIGGLFLFSSFVFAQEVPGLPMIIQGEVMINNQIAPENTLVTAMVGDEVVREFTLIENGNYILTLSSIDGQVDFYVNNIFTNQSINFESGKVIDLDLNVNVKHLNIIYWIFGIILVLVIIFFLISKFWKSKHFKNKKY